MSSPSFVRTLVCTLDFVAHHQPLGGATGVEWDLQRRAVPGVSPQSHQDRLFVREGHLALPGKIRFVQELEESKAGQPRKAKARGLSGRQ